MLPSLSEQPAEILIPLWRKLVPRIAANLTGLLPGRLAQQVLSGMPPNDAVRILYQMGGARREEFLESLDERNNFV